MTDAEKRLRSTIIFAILPNMIWLRWRNAEKYDYVKTDRS